MEGLCRVLQGTADDSALALFSWMETVDGSGLDEELLGDSPRDALGHGPVAG